VTGNVRSAVDESQRFPGKSLATSDASQVRGLLCQIDVHPRALLAGTCAIGQQRGFEIYPASQRLVVSVIGEPRTLSGQIRRDDEQSVAYRSSVVALVEDAAGIREVSQRLG